MTTAEPRPLTWVDHPSCIQVLDEVIDRIDVIGAFHHAARTLRPDNLDRRGILWLPKDDPDMNTEIAAQAAAGNRAYFDDSKRFGRPDILKALTNDKSFLFCADPREEGYGHLTRMSTNHRDAAAVGTDHPHIDEKPSDKIQHPPHIRALRYNLPPGSTVYERRFGLNDVTWTGNVIYPTNADTEEREKILGPAWRCSTPCAIFFMNIGGPVECQIAHNATKRPPFASDTPVITRQLDRYDFAARQQP